MLVQEKEGGAQQRAAAALKNYLLLWRILYLSTRYRIIISRSSNRQILLLLNLTFLDKDFLATCQMDSSRSEYVFLVFKWWENSPHLAICRFWNHSRSFHISPKSAWHVTAQHLLVEQILLNNRWRSLLFYRLGKYDEHRRAERWTALTSPSSQVHLYFSHQQ